MNIRPVADLFNNYRPDIAIADSNSICTLELTVCHETNVVSSQDYKRDKFANIADYPSTLTGNEKVHSHTIEISTLGFISNINDFTKLIGVSHMPIHFKQEIILTVLKSSYQATIVIVLLLLTAIGTMPQ